MREYAKVAPQFWTGKTGKQIREAGDDAQFIALYLITCPSANMIGLYYLPLPTLCHEIGCSLQGASKALRRLSEAHFAYYDEDSEQVWVPEMARFQLGDSLQPGDKRIIGLKKELQQRRSSPFFNAFLDKYRTAYHLSEISPSEAPSEALRSQEQEQEQDLSPQPPRGASARDNGLDEKAAAVIAYLNKQAGTDFLPTAKENLQAARARLRRFTLEDLRAVIRLKVSQWRDNPEMSGYLRPVTLFRATKFEGYLQEARRATTKATSEKEARTCTACGEAHFWQDGKRAEPCPADGGGRGGGG